MSESCLAEGNTTQSISFENVCVFSSKCHQTTSLGSSYLVPFAIVQMRAKTILLKSHIFTQTHKTATVQLDLAARSLTRDVGGDLSERSLAKSLCGPRPD